MEEFWKWPESTWSSGSMDWKDAARITLGLDVGSTSTQAAIMCDGELYSYANIHTGSNVKKAADRALKLAIGESGLTEDKFAAVGITGWGYGAVPTAKVFDEVHSHAKGGRYLFGPEVHTVVDLGGQTVAAIRLYDWDRVWDFYMNDKCATGFGRSIESLCDLLQVPIEEIGPISLQVDHDPEPVATSCYIMAETEDLGLLGRPEFRSDPLTLPEVYAKALFAFAWRCMSTIGRLSPLDVGPIKVYERIGFTGGCAKNVGITKRLERELKVEALSPRADPMLAGAIGAALLC